MENYPRDLLRKFLLSSGGSDNNNNNIDNTKTQTHQQQQNAQHHHSEGEEDDEGVELNLGLSLGGRFGVDKHANKNRLTRSSSVVGTMPLLREDAAASAVAAPPAPAYHMLVRASSLPTETEEQWRKRKELQTLRRMEAKRRRSEKQRVNKSERDAGSGGGLEEVDGGGGATMGMKLNRCDSSTPPFVLQNLGVGTTKQVVLNDTLGKGKIGVGFQGLYTQPSSQGSADSQGGSSSSVSEMDCKPFLGSSSCGEARSPASNQSQEAMPVGSSVAKTNENIARTSSKAEVEKNASKKPNMGREIGTNSVEDMPCVFTKGDGPNGRRIEGILYKYGKGEEVRIMCVCHGNFLSPAEFVKHAGGGDVEYPLRHIVINPSAAPFS